MARIRIVEEWLRCPGSAPTRWRSIMVVAEQWAEQRVLMRAYAESIDQTRPTIMLHGAELAIGPAGIDTHGPWGIHVHPQEDGRAQEIAHALREAARRLAGSKGNAPRLEDEVSDFDRKRTDNWSPGTPRAVPGIPQQPYYEPMVAASYPAGASYVPPPPTVNYVAPQPPPDGAHRMTPVPTPPSAVPIGTPVKRRRGWTQPHRPQATEPGARTALGYESGAGAQSAIVRLGLRPAAASQLGRIGDRTVPSDFEITKDERAVLNMLAEVDHLTARAIGQMVGALDPVAWMEALVVKLTTHGLDIVAPGPALGGEPTYRLQR
jgi:hypothetical protein